MKKFLITGLLAATVLSIGAPSEGGPLPVTGVIHGGSFNGGKSFSGCQQFRDLRFAGRMPAGAAAHNVLAGSGATDCVNPGFPLRMHGETPARSFDWDCVGPTVFRDWPLDLSDPPAAVVDAVKEPLADVVPDLPFDLLLKVLKRLDDLKGLAGSDGFLTTHATCVTQGFPGSFTMRMLLVIGQNYGPPFSFSYDVRGLYWVAPIVS